MNIGTIGTGSIVEKIIENVRKTKNLHVTAVYSRTQASGRRLADKFGIDKVYTDLEAMLCDPEIDIIYVASPNSLHYEQTKAALLHDKHVLCEKPMTPYEAQTKELFALAHEREKILLEAMTIAMAPNFACLKKAVNAVGKRRLVLCQYSQYSSRYDLLKSGQVTNVFDPQFCGGALMDINVYNIYTVAALFGRPEAVAYYPNLHENGIDTSGIAVLTYRDFVCHCAGAKDAVGENSIQIQGDDGYIVLHGSTNASPAVVLRKNDSECRQDMQPDGDQWYYEVQAWTQIFKDRDVAAARNLEQASVDTAWILEQARKSAGMTF